MTSPAFPSAGERRAAALAGLISFVRAHDGVVRVRRLLGERYSRHLVDTAIAQGAVRRIRKGWVALPEADPYLVAAARSGVVVSCVTQARRLGLWVLAEDRPHVAAPPHAGGVAAGLATVHWRKPLVPRHPDALVDPIENVLVLVATCQPSLSHKGCTPLADRGTRDSEEIGDPEGVRCRFHPPHRRIPQNGPP